VVGRGVIAWVKGRIKGQTKGTHCCASADKTPWKKKKKERCTLPVGKRREEIGSVIYILEGAALPDHQRDQKQAWGRGKRSENVADSGLAQNGWLSTTVWQVREKGEMESSKMATQRAGGVQSGIRGRRNGTKDQLLRQRKNVGFPGIEGRSGNNTQGDKVHTDCAKGYKYEVQKPLPSGRVAEIGDRRWVKRNDTKKGENEN